ncbi:MAG: M14 family metallopeptidase [Bacteroidia bacterium]|nr:M14 family metallopeptidase [Bacteroidia bacterium]
MKTISSSLSVLFFSILFVLCPFSPVNAQHTGIHEALMTRAERTSYMETSHNEDVVKFIEALRSGCPLVSVEQFGTTKMSNPLLLVIMANPKITTPEEAEASGKPVIYIQGNIHAGEVEGKEASMQLMRDIAFGSRKNLLDNQIVMFCPNYNPDGNDKFADNNRPSQEGSPKLTGVRASGEGLDLNREGMKVEAIEMKSLMKGVFHRWDPALFIDLHTDNGSWHGYMDNVAPSFQSAGMPEPTNFTMDLLKDAMHTVLDKSGINIFWHGYLSMRPNEQPTFTAYDHLPRYIANYVGLRNRMGILSEAFPHELFEKRILSNYYLLVSVLEYTGIHAKEVTALLAKADQETIEIIKTGAGKIQRGVNYDLAPEQDPVRMLIRETVPYTDANGRKRNRATGNLNWLENVKHSNHFVPTKLSTVPRTYVFPAELTGVARKLEEHGIVVKKVQKKVKIEGDEYIISKFSQSEREGYGGHKAVTLEGDFKRVKKTIPAGSFYVDMAQPLAWLIFYLMEPQSDDGLVYWNYFDEYLKKTGVEKGGVAYPVIKVNTEI